MDRIYQDAKDKYVSAVCVYGNGTDTFAYMDSTYKTKFKTSDLKEAFIKGSIVIIKDAYYTPVNYGVKESAGFVTYVKADSSTATTAVLGTLSAEADS